MWRLPKCFSINFPAFGTAPEGAGEENLKLFKTYPTRWLSHEDASNRLISRFSSLVHAIDNLISGKGSPGMNRPQDKLTEPKIRCKNL